jgi:IPT/TIG domain-containing protein/FG-GAP repeat protein
VSRSISNLGGDRALVERVASAAGAVSSRRALVAGMLLSVLLGLMPTGEAHAAFAPDGLLAGEGGESRLAQSVVVSADGNTALLGAPGADGEAGAVLVFTRTGSTWAQQAELTPSSGEEIGPGGFGSSVALSHDGDTALVGAPGDNAGVGAAWVFTRSESGAWTQQGGELAGGEEGGEGQFGRSVALGAEGNTALIGGPGDSGYVGAAWVFTHTGATWSQQGAKLTGGDESGPGEFGLSVALAKDAATALIGAPGDSANAGAAWVFASSSEGVWTQQGEKLTGSGEGGAGELGRSVALSSAGDTALVGGPADNANVGAAWVFTRSETGAWAQLGEKLTGSEEQGEASFGASVALSCDGAVALVGGPADDLDIGAAWPFTRSQAGTWTQQGGKLTGSGEEGEGHFGASVTLSCDGDTALVGAPAANGDTGVAWAFASPPSVSSVIPDEGPQAGGTSVTITGANLDEAAAVHFGASAATSFEVISATSITALAPAGAGTVDVSVTTSGGTSTTSPDDQFSYVPAPTVATEAASSITQTTATLHATVDPNGGVVSDCQLEYGASTSYGASVACTPSPGAGGSDVAVSAPLSGLIKNTTYHFRIVATNAGGTTPGADETFETAPGPPTVTFGEPTAIGQVSAILNAEVDPNGGVVTQCYFHYERLTAQPAVIITPCVGLPLSGESPAKVSALAEGLSAETRYSFSLEVINSFGEVGFGEAPAPFETLPGPEVLTGAAISVTQVAATLTATVNPNGGEVSSCEFEYGTSEAYASEPVPCESRPGAGKERVPVSAKLQGLSANTKYFFRIVATNPGATSRDTVGQTFTTLPDAPVAVTGEASSVTQTTASVSATVNEHGGRGSDCHFEYGPTTSYGASAPCTPTPEAGAEPVAVRAVLASLAPNTSYHVRIVAGNPGGTSRGDDATFTTLPDAPTVVTAAASSLTRSSATLRASVNPNGGRVSACQFEYGSSTAYGSSVPCSALPQAGTSPVAVSAVLAGLGANTTYHFRVLATNAGGASAGADETFTTEAVAPISATTTTAPPLTATSASPLTAMTLTPTPALEIQAASCRASLASATVGVAGAVAAVKLGWTGTNTDTCSGELMLRAKVRSTSERSKTMLVGSGSFSLPAGGIGIATLKLDGVGRALFNAARGRLSASLTILKLSPGPSQARTQTVLLAREARSPVKRG